MNKEEAMLIEGLTNQIETMNKNHREDNERFHTRLDEYNKCNLENTKTLTHQGGKIKGLQGDMDIVKPQAAQVGGLKTDMDIVLPHVQNELIKKKGKAWVLKTLKGFLWILMTIGSVYGLYMKFKV